MWAVEVSGDRLLSASADKTIRIWDIASRRYIVRGCPASNLKLAQRLIVMPGLLIVSGLGVAGRRQLFRWVLVACEALCPHAPLGAAF